jgi:Biotin-lipoyl like
MFLGGGELGQDGCHMRFAVVAVLLFLSAVGLGYTYNQNSSAPTFMTAPVERGSIATLVKASGTVEAVVSVDVSSQLSGRIAEVFVNFNDTVRAGQPIAQIDPEIFAARVNEARAALNVGGPPRNWRRLNRRRLKPSKMHGRGKSSDSYNWPVPEAESGGNWIRRGINGTWALPTCAHPLSRFR